MHRGNAPRRMPRISMPLIVANMHKRVPVSGSHSPIGVRPVSLRMGIGIVSDSQGCVRLGVSGSEVVHHLTRSCAASIIVTLNFPTLECAEDKKCIKGRKTGDNGRNDTVGVEAVFEILYPQTESNHSASAETCRRHAASPATKQYTLHLLLRRAICVLR